MAVEEIGFVEEKGREVDVWSVVVTWQGQSFTAGEVVFEHCGGERTDVEWVFFDFDEEVASFGNLDKALGFAEGYYTMKYEAKDAIRSLMEKF